jgi:hypothetical protein
MTQNPAPAQRLAAVMTELGCVSLLIACRMTRAMSDGNLDAARESWSVLRETLDPVLRGAEHASQDARRQ